MRIKKKERDKSGGVFIKIALVYTMVLLVVLAFVGITINSFCIKFIKEQRMKYNSQILEKAAYEMDGFYNHMNYLLSQLSNEDKYSKAKAQLSVDGESLFSKIKREVDFADSVKAATYANGIGEYYNGILFFDAENESYYIGSGKVDSKVSLLPYVKAAHEDKSPGGIGIMGPMQETFKNNYGNEKVVGFIKESNKGMSETSDKNGDNQYVMITIELDKLVGILKDILLDDKGFFITDAKDKVIYESGLDKINIRPEELKEQNGSVNVGGEKILVTSAALEQFGWHLSVAEGEDVLFQDVTLLMKQVALFIGLGSLLGTGLFLMISRKVLFPIELLKNMLHQVARDNETYLEVVPADEAGEISRVINEMKKRIKKLTENQYLLEMKTTEARLQVLQSQINPHFLYNTLDNIYCIAQIEEIEPITILTKNLSEMLRYSIDTKQMFVSLAEEIRYLKAYLNIINIRYEDRVSLKIQVEECVTDCQVFRLLLQPLVENACIHGILPSKVVKGIICITAKKDGKDVVIEVRNNGVILSDDKLKEISKKLAGEGSFVPRECRKGAGIALENVNERIRLFYGKEYGMTMERIDGWGTCVRIRQKYMAVKWSKK